MNNILRSITKTSDVQFVFIPFQSMLQFLLGSQAYIPPHLDSSVSIYAGLVLSLTKYIWPNKHHGSIWQFFRGFPINRNILYIYISAIFKLCAMFKIIADPEAWDVRCFIEPVTLKKSCVYDQQISSANKLIIVKNFIVTELQFTLLFGICVMSWHNIWNLQPLRADLIYCTLPGIE